MNRESMQPFLSYMTTKRRGMLEVRRFKVVYRHPDLRVDALNIDEADGRIVNYTGKKLKIKLK